jgi:hypothetical protein
MQALTQAGSTQCMHCAFMNDSPASPLYSLMTFFARALSAMGASYLASKPDVSRGRPFASWQATTHA